MFKIEYLGSTFFAFALLHTFLVSKFAQAAHSFKKDSKFYILLHLLSEVEIVFGFWAILFLILWVFVEGLSPVISYQESVSFNEPIFIFCIMLVSSSRPVITFARQLIIKVSAILSSTFKFHPLYVQFFILMVIGPLLGSFITEPAAITITGLLLYRMIKKGISDRLLYSILALLFVNVSIGGALTHFAAPPILIVAHAWNWGWSDVLTHLGAPAVVSLLLSTGALVFMNRKALSEELQVIEKDHYPMPVGIVLLHLLFLGLLVQFAHHSPVLLSLTGLFILLTRITKKFQDELKIRQSLLVGFFLAGLIEFGPFQKWWLEPLMGVLNDRFLYLGAVALTAVTDNAALTYLGSQVSGLSEISKWALGGGALVGGGLTILANAPNPAGFSILSSHFPDSSLSALKLFKAAFLPTLIALICFYIRIFMIS